MPLRRALALACVTLIPTLAALAECRAADPWVQYQGTSGPGLNRRVVLISGDEEYRSEEALPQLAKILATRHGFTCTVLFAIGPDGAIDPTVTTNIPGLEALRTADLMILATRFRNLPPDQMREIAAYVESGRPIIGLRTATHAFNIPADKPFAHYSWQSKAPGWEGGFGRHVLGETWVAHHGKHGKESTFGVFPPSKDDRPILRGIEAWGIWGPTDVYTAHPPADCVVLVSGYVAPDMSSTRPDFSSARAETPGPDKDPRNNPMMPIAWTRSFPTTHGDSARVFTTTMGAATDLSNAGVRRLLVNATFWAMRMEYAITPDLNVDLVGKYEPTPFGFGGFRKGIRPESLAD